MVILLIEDDLTLARELGLPRSTTYHLLAELQAADLVVHLPEERAYGLGVAAFEVGSAYLRHDPVTCSECRRRRATDHQGRPVLGNKREGNDNE